MEILIYTGIAFIAGFAVAWLIQTMAIAKMKKSSKSTEGDLEREKLIKETLQKEITQVYQMKETAEGELQKKLIANQQLLKQMDEDIILLQKSNEETEKLLQTSEPALHEMKLKSIEANNTIARYKAQLTNNKNA